MKVLRALRRHGRARYQPPQRRVHAALEPAAAYPLVDDKLLTKELCARAGIPTPRLLAVAHHHFELRHLRGAMAKLTSFVLKPAHGAMGNGILVIRERDGARFRLAGGRSVALDDLVYHAAGVISGLYALAGQTDAAIVEERLLVHPTSPIAPRAFLTCASSSTAAFGDGDDTPSDASGGRANLHQGAVRPASTSRAVAPHTRSRAVRSASTLTRARRCSTHDPASGRARLQPCAADETGLGYVARTWRGRGRGPVLLDERAPLPDDPARQPRRLAAAAARRRPQRGDAAQRRGAHRARRRDRARGGVVKRSSIAALAWIALFAASARAQRAEPLAAPGYEVRYEVRIVPTEKTAHVAMHVTDPANLLRSLRFRVDPERQLAFRGDGHVQVEEETVAWTPRKGGGVLRWAVRIDHLRDESSYDARCTCSACCAATT
jgi:hypothetical protein